MDCSTPGSSTHGIFQARILEGVAISFSKGSSQLKDRTQVSYVAGGFFTNWVTRELHLAPMHLSPQLNSAHSFLFGWLCLSLLFPNTKFRSHFFQDTLLPLPGAGWGFYMRACSNTVVVAASDYHTVSPLFCTPEHWAPRAQGLSFPSLSPWQRTWGMVDVQRRL